MIRFISRLNSYPRSQYFATIFTQANLNTVYESILKNNMDESSFNNWNESLTKTINQPRQAFGGYQDDVSAISVTACKVSLQSFFITGT